MDMGSGARARCVGISILARWGVASRSPGAFPEMAARGVVARAAREILVIRRPSSFARNHLGPGGGVCVVGCSRSREVWRDIPEIRPTTTKKHQKASKIHVFHGFFQSF